MKVVEWRGFCAGMMPTIWSWHPYYVAELRRRVSDPRPLQQSFDALHRDQGFASDLQATKFVGPNQLVNFGAARRHDALRLWDRDCQRFHFLLLSSAA